MKWEHLYQYYDGWSTSTLVKRLSALEDYGAPEQIIEVADATCDEKASCRLIRNAIDAGVRFSPENLLELDGVIDTETMCYAVRALLRQGTVFSHETITEMDGVVDDETLTAVVKFAIEHGESYTANEIMELDGIVDPSVLTLAAKVSGATFSPQELTELDGIVNHDVLVAIDKRQGTMTFDYEDEPLEPAHREKRPGGLFKAVAFLGMMEEVREKKKTPRFRIGDHVRVRYRGQEGSIVDINGSLYMVSLDDGRHVDSYPESQLEKAW